jgi:hypothetical protein
VSLPAKLWQGPSAVGEAADRANKVLLPGLPYCTHSGPGFRADKKGEFSEVFLDRETHAEDEDSWVSLASPFLDDNVHVVSSDDPRRSFRRRLTTTSATSGWTSASPVPVPDSKGKGYFFTTEPFFAPFAELDMQLLGRYGRSVQHQYHVHAWAYSIEFSIGFTTPIFNTEMYHINGAECHIRSENWAYMDGATQRNCLLLKATIKSDAGWVEYELASPEVMEHADIGFARMRALTPSKMVIVVCEHPNEYPSLYYGQPLGGPWTKAASNLAAAFPNEVPHNASYWATEAAWSAAHPSTTDPGAIRIGFLSQMTYKMRIRRRGSQTELDPLDSDHIVYSTGSYPCAEASALVGLSISVVNVNTGAVSNTLHRQFGAAARAYYSTVTMLGKDSWVVEFISGTYSSSPTIYPLVEEAYVTFDRGATYTALSFPAGYVPQTITVVRPIAEVTGGVPEKFVAVCQVMEDGDRRMYKTDDLTTFVRGGRLAKASLTDVYQDFLQVIKLGTRKDPGRINYVAPWANDTRQSPPEWW